MININVEIKKLVEYGKKKHFITNDDEIYCINQILSILNLVEYKDVPRDFPDEPVEDILNIMRTWAVANNVVENDSNDVLDLLDTKIMGIFASKPSEFRKQFFDYYHESPVKATEFYYDYAKNINYIREQRIAKDIKWVHETPYGNLDMTINLSKPEKDPRAIAKSAKISSNYPKCLLCKENEGYAGRLDHPARQNHRIVPMTLANESWYMQYSPYVYYNEHCIVFKGEHDPMKITKLTIERLLDFVELFPHYMMGSNADLPIVGGSILTHDHFQGGNYTFAMAEAKELNQVHLASVDVEASTLHWPMSVIRLKGEEKKNLIQVADQIINKWKVYSDPEVNILSHTKGEEHNTITPITRFRDGKFEVDLILRNNRTSEKHPFGIFHSHQKYHHIKWENIGLIECMGLAVLPSRLKTEMALMKDHIKSKTIDAMENSEALHKHMNFALDIVEKYKAMSETEFHENLDAIVEMEIGEVFYHVLLNCGVFKDTEEGQQAFRKCCEVMYENFV